MKLVVIGNGIAGISTARYVAERDPSAEITVYSDEPYEYYPRPRLIDLVAGDVAAEQIIQYPPDWYAKRHINTVLQRPVRQIKPQFHEIVLDNDETVRYDRLLLANGAHNWVPPIPGADSHGVYTLRNLEDALTLCEKADQVRRIVILGGGLLGLEFAVAFRAHGPEITVVELLPWLLPRQLDAPGAAILEEIICSHGVDIVTGDSCVRISGAEGDMHLTLKSGRELLADLIVVSAGIRPNIDLPAASGLAVQRGVLVDQHLLTDAPDVYAVGDVAEFHERVWGIIPAAVAQARVAAAHMTGDADAAYEDIVPSTTLKVTGLDLMSLGEVNPEGEGFTEVRSVDKEAGVYKKLVIRQGRVVGAILLGDRSSVRLVNQLVTSGMDVSGYENELLRDGFDIRVLQRV